VDQLRQENGENSHRVHIPISLLPLQMLIDLAEPFLPHLWCWAMSNVSKEIQTYGKETHEIDLHNAI